MQFGLCKIVAAGSSTLLAQDSDGGGVILSLFYLAIIVVVVIGMWKVYEKAGQPGWAAIIPIYNVYILCKIAGKPPIWIVLMLIPFVNIVISIIISIAVAKSFGKSEGYGVGLALLPFVFYPMLGFSDAQYQGPRGG